MFFNGRARRTRRCACFVPAAPREPAVRHPARGRRQYKPKSGKLEIELPREGEAANERNVDPEAAPNLRADRRALVSAETPTREGYCVGAMRDGALHLTPVDAAFQMRLLAHLDAADDRRKRRTSSWAARRRGARGAGRRGRRRPATTTERPRASPAGCLSARAKTKRARA